MGSDADDYGNIAPAGTKHVGSKFFQRDGPPGAKILVSFEPNARNGKTTFQAAAIDDVCYTTAGIYVPATR